MLTPSVFSDQFDSIIKGFLSLDDDLLPITDAEGNAMPSTGDYASGFASSYEAYSLTGVIPGAVHGSQDPSLLENYFRGRSISTITDFATVLANYWSTVLLVPGAPAHGGDVVSGVTNDAEFRITDFELAISVTLTQQQVLPVFSKFINDVETFALPAVTWYVTEVFDGTPQVFPEKVV